MDQVEGIVFDADSSEVRIDLTKLLHSLGLANTPGNGVVAAKAAAAWLGRKMPGLLQAITCPDCKGKGCLYLFGPPVTCTRCQGRKTIER